jgi:hypothetical protein
MPLNYWKEDADDGTDTDASIQPIENGEPVEETYLNRAAQNLRNRTEEVRVLTDELQAINRSDRKLILSARPDTKVLLVDPTVVGEYIFYVNNTGTSGGGWNRDILLTPMLSPSKLNSTEAVPARFYYQQDGSNGLVVEMDNIGVPLHPRKVAEGSHDIFLQLVKDASVTGTPVVEIKANNPAAPDPEDGPVYIIVKIKSDDTSTIGEIDAAIDASTAGSIVTASTYGVGSTAVDLGGGTSWGPFRAYESDAGPVGYGAQGGVDDEGYIIPASALSNLFTTQARRMKEGDTLFVDFASAKARMTYNTGATTPIGYEDLHLVSSDERTGTDTRNLGDASGPVPLCKLIKDDNSEYQLVFMHHRVFEDDVGDYLLNSKSSAAADDLRAELANAGGSPNGDYMIGAEAKTTNGPSLSAGTVNSQIQELGDDFGDNTSASQGSALVGEEAMGQTHTNTGISTSLSRATVRSHMATVNDRYADTDGADEIGASDKTGTGSGKTLGGSAGTRDVNAQLQGLLDYYDNHVDIASPADRHTYANLRGKPRYTVHSTADYGDYQTLQGAINAGWSNIDLQSMSSSEDVSFTGLSDHIIQGQWFGASLWQAPSSSANCASFSGDAYGTVIFRDIKFLSSTGSTAAQIHVSDTHATYGLTLVFDNCEFSGNQVADRSVIHVATNATQGPVTIILRNCTVKGTINSTEFLDLIRVQSGKCNVEIVDCEFDEFTRLVRYDDQSGIQIGTLKFVRNRFKNVGWTKSDGTTHFPVLWMEDPDSDEIEFVVAHNVWEVGDGGQNTGNFCSIGGRGNVSHNVCNQEIGYNATSNHRAFIYIGGDEECAVIGNVLYHKKGDAISAAGGAVIGNRVRDVSYGSTTISGGDIIGNDINYSSETVVSTGISVGSSAIGNKLSGLSVSNSKGIYTSGGACRISDNYVGITGAGTTGIWLFGTDSSTTLFASRCLVSNNYVTGRTGIKVDGISDDDADLSWGSVMHMITNNLIKCDDDSGSIGIDIRKPYCMVSNNIITVRVWEDSPNTGIGTGIDFNNEDHIACSGNMILPGVGSDVLAPGTECGIGVGTATDLTHNWYNYSWLTPL